MIWTSQMAERLAPSRREILRSLAPGHLIQPATALWRVYEIEAVRLHAPLHGRVLDLGCGDGSLSRVIFDGVREVTGVVGLEPDATDAAEARRSGVYVDVHCAPGDAVPAPDATFDTVFSNSVLEHIPSIETVLAESARVLKAGGRFVATVPSDEFHASRGSSRWYSALARLHGQTEAEAIDQRLAHHRYWSPEDWRGALAAAGLSLELTRRYLPGKVMRSWQRMSNATGGLAFELFQRRATTRGAQRRMGLPALTEHLSPAAQARLLELAIGRACETPPDVGDSPSGGLLVVATRRASA